MEVLESVIKKLEALVVVEEVQALFGRSLGTKMFGEFGVEERLGVFEGYKERVVEGLEECGGCGRFLNGEGEKEVVKKAEGKVAAIKAEGEVEDEGIVV